MADFNHGHIQWESLESAGGDDHQFLLLTQDQIHFNIKVKPGNTYKNNGGGTSTKANIKR